MHRPYGDEYWDEAGWYEGLDETEVEIDTSELERKTGLPIKQWSYSSLMGFLANPLAWHKRYVEKVYDMPSAPSAVVGRACHLAMQHFYSGIAKEGAIDLGLEFIVNVPDFEVKFGKRDTSRLAKKKRREKMRRDYLQAVSFYFAKPPKYDVVAVEFRSGANVKDLPLPIKAVSDLVVKSKGNRGALDIVDHKFVDHFSPMKGAKTLFIIQAIFNYYTVREYFKKPVKRFIVQELKKSKNLDGRSQLRKYAIHFEKHAAEFKILHRLINDATNQLRNTEVFLPNPQDMFEGENSFDIYRLGLGTRK